MTAPADRPRFVLNGTSFPAERRELIARAEYYGADPATLRELQSLEQRRYAGLTDIIDAINRFHRKPTERSGSGTAQSQRKDLK